MQAEKLARENQALRERLSRLSEASLRINESLDVETVLQGVLDSARALTDARYGVITLLDDAGEPQAFLASGMTPEQARKVWDMPGGMQFFGALRGLRESVRLRDFQGHLRSLGLPELRPPLPVHPVISFLGAPVRHGGESVGHIYLAQKEGAAEFTREDEETLVVFASQAALVIANARRYRDEQRARSDLETLVDTSPTGVVVFDAETGAPVFNREAARIMEGLLTPEQTPQQLLETLTVQRTDGREIFLKSSPWPQALSAGETLRAEEVVLQVPDGRRVTVLISATPIRAEEGGVKSYVVTLQDMTPLEELDRLRAEFLAMVSHELRTPLAAIKGATVSLLADPDAGWAETVPFFRIVDEQADHMRGLINDLLDVARIETGTLSVHPEPAALAGLVDQARNTFLGTGSRHILRIELPTDLPPVMADRRRILQVLDNLLANAARHSPESAPIRVTAAPEEGHVAVTVADQGQGVPAERLPHLFRRFPRLDGGGEAGLGPGLGLPICKGLLEAHGGRIRAESDGEGRGTRFIFTLPLAEEAGHGPPPGSTTPGAQHEVTGETRVLVVDDDPHALRNVRDALRKAGYAPVATADPEEVAGLMEKHRPHLVLLDLVLPGADGVELMQGLLEIADVPVLFLSAYGQEDAIARALDAGAADYLVKPFAPTELAARIRAALRKGAAAGPPPPEEPYVRGDLTIDYAGREVTVGGRPVRLTDLEYRLLAELSVHAGRVLTYEQLLQRVWGPARAGDPRPLRSAVKKLRRKLGDDPGNPTWIFNEPRAGYRMAKAG